MEQTCLDECGGAGAQEGRGHEKCTGPVPKASRHPFFGQSGAALSLDVLPKQCCRVQDVGDHWKILCHRRRGHIGRFGYFSHRQRRQIRDHMGRRKAPSRQEQIARELGLLPELVRPKRKYEQLNPPKPEAIPTVEFAGRERHGDDCPGGRHKLTDGRWCINGRVYSHAEIFAMRQLNLRQDGLAAKVVNMPAFRMLDDLLGLDLSTIRVSECS